MPFELSSQPRGLMALLGSKVMGTAPRELADQVVGVIELLEFYTLNIRETATAGQVTPAIGGNVFTGTTLTVPAGEAWIVHAYNVECQCAAGEAIDLQAAVTLAGGGQMMGVGDYFAAAATQNVRAWAPNQFTAGPGAVFGFNVRSLTLTPDVFGWLTFSRVRV
jgi:hypothetical protein